MLNPKRVRFLCVCVIVVLTLTAMGTVFAGAVQPRYSTSFSDVRSGEYTPALTKTTAGAPAYIKITNSGGWNVRTYCSTDREFVSNKVSVKQNELKSIPYNSGKGQTGKTYKAQLTFINVTYKANGTWDPS